ncbi:hypothetical protein Tco_1096052 [Tanacetum coccineum]
MSQESNNDMEYDPSDVEFTTWLASRFFNYKTMDHYTKRALWIYCLRGDDEVELTNEESSDTNDEEEVARIFRIETNVFDFETPLCRTFKEFNYLLQIDPDVLNKDIEGFKTYAEYKDDWIYEWCENVPWVHEKLWTKPAPVVHYSSRNKAILEGLINEDDESSNNGWRRWDNYKIAGHDQEEKEYENEHEDEERCELSDDHELSVCTIRRF